MADKARKGRDPPDQEAIEAQASLDGLSPLCRWIACWSDTSDVFPTAQETWRVEKRGGYYFAVCTAPQRWNVVDITSPACAA